MSYHDEKKKPAVDTKSISSSASSRTSVSTRQTRCKGGRASASRSSSRSTKSVLGSTISWQEAHQRAQRFPAARTNIRKPIRCSLRNHIVEDLRLRRLEPQEVPATGRNLITDSPLTRYLVDGRIDSIERLVLEFSLPGTELPQCKVPLADCTFAPSVSPRHAIKLRESFTKLIGVLERHPGTSAIRLAHSLQVNEVVFAKGEIAGWASWARIAVMEAWEDESKFVRDAPLVGLSTERASASTITTHVDGQRLEWLTWEYSDKSRKKLDKWLGPRQTLESNPKIIHYANVRVVNIKRNMFGDILSCELKQVTAAPGLERHTGMASLFR